MSIDLFSPETVSVMAKYGLVFNPMDMGGSVRQIQDKVWAIQANIDSAKEGNSEAVKVANHPYDVKASKDKKAAEVASALITEFLAKVDAAITKNANVAFALNEVKDAVTGYLTEEVNHWRMKAAPSKPVSSGSQLDTLYDERKVLSQAVKGLLLGMPNLANALECENGKVKLPNLQGAGGSKKAESPTGRYAKWQNKSVRWSIDGVNYPGDTHWSDLLRVIWHGADRVGKKAADLFDPIDQARKKAKDDKAMVTVTINGKVVTYQHITE